MSPASRPLLRSLPFLLLLTTGCASAPPPPPPAPTPVPVASPVRPAPPPLPSVRELRRTVVILSRRAGTSVTRVLAGTSLTFSYQHLDNGRGPTVEGQAHLALDGTLGGFHARGKHTMGNPIEEKLEVAGKRARWKSREEQGESELGGPAFYVPIAPWPEATGFLYEALKRAGGTMRLLPGGEARLTRERAFTVKVKGEDRQVQAWSISGLDFQPTRIWTDGAGQFLGVVDAWYSCISQGWEEAVEPLVKLQDGLEAERDRGLAGQLARRPGPAGFVVRGARVLDVERGRWLKDHAVVVAGGKIVAVGPDAAVKVPAGAEVIEARGQALLPGLWDMHAHLGPPDGVLDLASGVTTVRDLGNDPDRLDDYKKRFDEGLAIGPRVLRSGFIEGRGEKAAGSKVTATTAEEAARAVAFYAARGYEGIKIYNSVKPELVPVLTRLAHARKMRVSGHIPMGMLARDAVRAGYDEIQHVNMLFLNFFADRTTDTRTPLRFSLVADNAPGFDLAAPPVKAFLAQLIARRIVVDPTAGAFEGLFVARPGEVPKSLTALVARLPVQVQRGFRTGGLVVPAGKEGHYSAAFDKMLEMIRLLHRSRIRLVAGTDSIAGVMLHHELALYARAGIPPAEVLRLATLGSARIMGRERTSGSIARGKDADFFLVDGDPLARLEELRRISLVSRGGVLHDAARLREAVGVAP